jgi:predicted acylesterase/phospholipase RssA
MKQAENPLLVDLALQGGGSHGAFTSGVLDRLLEESRLRIEVIFGTSAGAMNAAALADGWTEGGAEGARLARQVLAARIARGCIQPAATLSAGSSHGPLDARYIASLRRDGSTLTRDVAV